MPFSHNWITTYMVSGSARRIGSSHLLEIEDIPVWGIEGMPPSAQPCTPRTRLLQPPGHRWSAKRYGYRRLRLDCHNYRSLIARFCRFRACEGWCFVRIAAFILRAYWHYFRWLSRISFADFTLRATINYYCIRAIIATTSRYSVPFMTRARFAHFQCYHFAWLSKYRRRDAYLLSHSAAPLPQVALISTKPWQPYYWLGQPHILLGLYFRIAIFYFDARYFDFEPLR
jgi:hypothetical protein